MGTPSASTTASSPLPFAHAQLHAGKFEGDPQRFSKVAEIIGKGQVHRDNVRQVWKRKLKAHEQQTDPCDMVGKRSSEGQACLDAVRARVWILKRACALTAALNQIYLDTMWLEY